jgi:hypothetical protein
MIWLALLALFVSSWAVILSFVVMLFIGPLGPFEFGVLWGLMLNGLFYGCLIAGIHWGENKDLVSRRTKSGLLYCTEEMCIYNMNCECLGSVLTGEYEFEPDTVECPSFVDYRPGCHLPFSVDRKV